ncbi:hypothetical protein PMLGA01_040016700 [Plasmodium malariae]|uniref:Uncharacterized protein n=1 Tax=Plasmodium malariae TaxID=5858 RepID=A0A1C3KAN9_PLAMA|nr:hypothetical protein PMLGA01_040016700 [Plasmodium malariae]
MFNTDVLVANVSTKKEAELYNCNLKDSISFYCNLYYNSLDAEKANNLKNKKDKNEEAIIEDKVCSRANSVDPKKLEKCANFCERK